MATSIPQELVDTIIDFLHNDKLSLYNSSLVCKSWRTSAQLHLFHHVTIIVNSDSSSSLRQFQEALETNLTIGTFVRSITLRGLMSTPPWRPDLLPLVNAPIVRILLSRLHSVQRISLESIIWEAPLVQLDTLPVTLPGQIVALSLREICSHVGPRPFLSTAGAVDILQSFSSISSLDISTTVLQSDVVGEAIELASLPVLFRSLSLRNLSIHNTSHVNIFTTGLAYTNSTRTLQSINIQPRLLSDGYCFGSLLSKLATDGALRELGVHLDADSHPLFLTLGAAERTIIPRLPALSSLKILTIRVSTTYYSIIPFEARLAITPRTSGLAVLPQFFHSLPPSLDTLELVVVVPDQCSDTVVRGQVYAEFLQGEEFGRGVQELRKAGLKKIELEVVRPESETGHDLRLTVEDGMVAALQGLPLLRRRGASSPSTSWS
ncbi:hypothetical protein EIP91_012334 [Steccherinum ochraceum]|uniref:Uncharacterized protein n=1 Tax=Steccherinum ochraceum TaxID=92696 RepID=A0A4R0RKN7_9APHY|nr:hypothetical protein EIP91_012334 [Steccherinum ochraceum]